MAKSHRRLHATSSIRLIWPLLDLARKHGHDVSRVGALLGLTDAELADPETRVPQQLVARLLDDAIARSGVRDLGLLAARWVDSRHFGIGEYVARTQPTLQAAAELYQRYLPLLGDDTGFAIKQDGDHLILRLWFSPDLVLHEAAYEFAIGIGVLRARRITGIEDLAPLSVHFMHARPENTKRHEKLFRCPVHFEADVTHVGVSKAAFEMKLPGAEPVLGDVLTRAADALLEKLPRGNATQMRKASARKSRRPR